jgi:hypothetical protein
LKFYIHLVFFMVVWYVWTKKNLATLTHSRRIGFWVYIRATGETKKCIRNELGRSGGLVRPDGERGGQTAGESSGDSEPEGSADVAVAAEREGSRVAAAVGLGQML